MIERLFTIEDQRRFAELSGDCNKLHVDEVAARRFLFGGAVVHGIHMVCWALEQWLASEDNPVRLVALTADFTKNLPVGETAGCRIEQKADDAVSFEISDGRQSYASITIRVAAGNDLPGMPLAQSPSAPVECRMRSADEVAAAQGSLELFLDCSSARQLFPAIVAKLPLLQFAEILGTTRLVGMECPGFHSIFSGLDIRWDETGSDTPLLRYAVTDFEPRFSVLRMRIDAPWMQGTIKAFLRPPVTPQMSGAEAAKLITPGEFRGQKALVVGGSRGLGEISAKLLAAGGAQVMLTYVKGREDAGAVAREIEQAGGSAQVSFFDALDPAREGSEAVARFAPTHLYYFATPLIASNRGPFSEKLFEKFCEYYVCGFARTVEYLRGRGTGALRILYPSTVYVEDLPSGFAEYGSAKAAGESLCSYMERTVQGISIFKARFVRMATDQTAGVVAAPRTDPAPVVLKHLRESLYYTKEER